MRLHWRLQCRREVSKEDSGMRLWQLDPSVYTTYPKGTAWNLQHPFCPVCKLYWIKHGLNSSENEWLHNLFQSFHHKWRQGNRTEIIQLFWSRLFQDKINSGHFPETGYKMLIYESPKKVSKNATELISTKFQSSAISIIQALTLFTLIPFNNLFSASQICSYFENDPTYVNPVLIWPTIFLNVQAFSGEKKKSQGNGPLAEKMTRQKEYED